MSSQGPNNPTAVSGGAGWLNLSNVEGNGSNALTNTVAAGNAAVCTTLLSTGYGFSIPAGQAIVGIEITINASYNNGAGDVSTIHAVQLLKAGSPVGSSKGGNSLTTLSADYTLGASNDLWGTTWSVSDINNSNFGFEANFFVNNADGGSVARVATKNWRITVFYQSPVSKAICSQVIGL